MSTEPRTVQVLTLDHGTVTLTCPAWCVGHGPRAEYRADIVHSGPEQPLTVPTRRGEVTHLVTALECRPFATDPFFREVFAAVALDGDWYPSGPAELDAIADRLTAHAEAVRVLADELRALLANGGESR